MAIYSFNHDSFGKTTNRAGAAGDNAAYNARENETRLDHARQDGSAGGNAAYNAREEALRGATPVCRDALGAQAAERLRRAHA